MKFSVVFALLCFASCATQKSAYEVTATDKKFLSEVLAAVERKDTAWIVRQSLLPMAITSREGRRLVKTEAEFAAIIARSFSNELLQQMKAEAKKPLFKNWSGVMLGDGILWFSEHGESEAGPWRYRIVAFGGFAFQLTEEEANQ